MAEGVVSLLRASILTSPLGFCALVDITEQVDECNFAISRAGFVPASSEARSLWKLITRETNRYYARTNEDDRQITITMEGDRTHKSGAYNELCHLTTGLTSIGKTTSHTQI